MNIEYRMSNIEINSGSQQNDTSARSPYPIPNTEHRISYTAYLLLLFICLFPHQTQAAQSCITEGCHSELQEKFLVHPAEYTCTDCHTGDYDNHDQLEVRLGLSQEMCMECHEEVAEHSFPHAPVAEKNCSSCHDPHATPESFLLRNNHPTQFYVDYSKDQYGLCFSCHKPELMMYPETAFSTGFRHGIRNLHYLHVNKEKRGRNCKACHDVHGSENPKLMAGTVGFGNWQMDINFQISEKGGSCAPGCHRPQKYDREEHQ